MYDVTIIGNNTESYTAALYCARKNLSTLVLEIPSVLGDDLETLKLIHKLKRSACDHGADCHSVNIFSIEMKRTPKLIHTNLGVYVSHCIILAMGKIPNKLGLPGEEKLCGNGLNYHDSCSTPYLKSKTVAVIGDNMTAVNHALTLSGLCKRIYVISGENLNADSPSMETLQNTPNITLLQHTLVVGLLGRPARVAGTKVGGIKVVDKTTGNQSTIECDAIFVTNESIPNTKLCKPYVLLDNSGYVITDRYGRTNVDGVFAAGSLRAMGNKRAATEGAVAANNVINYLN